MRTWIQQAGIILFVIGATLFVASSTTFQQRMTPGLADVEQTREAEEVAKDERTSHKEAKETAPPEKEKEAITALQNEVKQLKKELAAKKTDDEAVEQATVKKADAKIVLDVEDGVSSPDIAAILKEAKMIDDEKAFNDFLIQEGYATKIRPGTYEIDYSMDPHTIGRIITHQQ